MRDELASPANIVITGAGRAMSKSLAAHLTEAGAQVSLLGFGEGLPWPSDEWPEAGTTSCAGMLGRLLGDEVTLTALVCVTEMPLISAETSAAERLAQYFFRNVVAVDDVVHAASRYLGFDSRIVFLLSAAALDPDADSPVHAATMAAARNLLQSWALTLAHRNIKANAVCVRPELLTEPGPHAFPAPIAQACDTVSFLLSAESRDITGQTMRVS